MWTGTPGRGGPGQGGASQEQSCFRASLPASSALGPGQGPGRAIARACTPLPGPAWHFLCLGNCHQPPLLTSAALRQVPWDTICPRAWAWDGDWQWRPCLHLPLNSAANPEFPAQEHVPGRASRPPSCWGTCVPMKCLCSDNWGEFRLTQSSGTRRSNVWPSVSKGWPHLLRPLGSTALGLSPRRAF